MATEAGGLAFALGQPPLKVTVLAQLTDGSALDPFEVQLPQLRAAVAIKAHAWADRRHRNDAIDIARLLHAAEAAQLGPDDFAESVSLRDAVAISDAASVRQRLTESASSTTILGCARSSPRCASRWSAEPT